MANVLNRTTKQYLTSVHTPDYPSVDWIHNPDLSAVNDQPVRYWVITGDTVTLMSPAEQAAVDAQLLSDARDVVANELDALEGVLRALVRVLLTELNGHADKMNEITAAIAGANNAGQIISNVAAIAAYQQRTLAQVKAALRTNLGT